MVSQKNLLSLQNQKRFTELSKSNSSFRWRSDTILIFCLRICAAIAAAVVLLIIFFLLKESLPLFQTVGVTRFFTDPAWHPRDGSYNLVPMLVGTLMAMVCSVVVATPI